LKRLKLILLPHARSRVFVNANLVGAVSRMLADVAAGAQRSRHHEHTHTQTDKVIKKETETT